MAALPGLGGRGINSRPHGPPAPASRTASCSRHRIRRPKAGRAHLAQAPAAGGGSGPHGPGAGRGRPSRDQRGVEGKVWEGRSASLDATSGSFSLPILPVRASPVAGARGGRWLCSLRRALFLPGRPGKETGCGVEDLGGAGTLSSARQEVGGVRRRLAPCGNRLA